MPITKKYNPKTGRDDTVGVDAELSDAELSDRRATRKMSTTAGADLEGVSRRSKASGVPKEETDPEKMSPLQRASYNARRKRQSASTAGDALASRSKY
jgi:hypothetical protein